MARNKARRPGGPTEPADPDAAPKAAQGEAAAPPAAIGDAQPHPASAGNGQSTTPATSPAVARTESPADRPRASAPLPAAGSPPPAAGSAGAAAGGAGAAGAGAGGGKPPEDGPPRHATVSGSSAPPGGSPPPRSPGAGGPPSRSSAAFLWGLAGGVIGGILAALAATYLLPPAGDLAAVRSQVSDQTATVEQMRARLEALEGTDAQTRERVAALETAADALPASDEMAGRIADADARLAALGEQVRALGADGDGGERLAALQDQLSKLSATVGELQRGRSGSGGSAQIAELERRLDQLAQDSDRLAALSGKLDALAGQVATGQERAGQGARDVAALSGQLKLLDERAEGVAAEVGALGSRVASVEERMAAGGDVGGRAAALTLLAGQLAAAIEQGEAYQAPLESLRALGAEDPAVDEAAAELEPSASAGVPTLKQLRDSFESTADEIVRSAQGPAGDGMLERAAGSLMRLVTIRPVGADAEGDHAAARVARAEARLADGDLAGAVAELEGLEGPPAEAAAPWLEQARARLAAQDALDRLHAHATDLLAQSR
jgi:hypothetical protein